MNLVELLKGQLSGEVSKKLGSMIGASESDIGKILGVGVPAVLSGLGGVASTQNGAEKLASAINGLDSSSFGDLGKMLSGNAASSSGGLIDGLLGGNALDTLATVIAKFTGLDASLIKKGLGSLAPLVLGSIGATFGGAKPDGAGVARLFREQKDNINAAMPAGISLGNIPGLSSMASQLGEHAPQTAGAIRNLVLPGVLIVAAVSSLVYFLNKPENEMVQDGEVTIIVPPEQQGGGQSNAAGAPPAAPPSKEELPSADESLGVDSLKSLLSGTAGTLASKLEAISDAAGAEAALPALQESLAGFEKISTSLKALPSEGKSLVAPLLASQLEKLQPLIEKIAGLPGIGDPLKKILEQLKEKMTNLVG